MLLLTSSPIDPRSSRHVPLLLPPGTLEVSLEQPVEEEPRELGVVVDLLVELEVGVDQLLDLVVGDVVERQSGVLGDVDLDTGLESGVLVESRFQVLDDTLSASVK